MSLEHSRRRGKNLLLIDKYAYTNKLANTNPIKKFITVVMSLFITTVINNNYVNVLVFITMVILTTYVAGIPIDKYLKILSIPMGFLLLACLSIVFSISYENVYIYSVNLWSFYIGITKESIDLSINLITKVIASMSATFFLGLTTPLNDLIKVFKRLKVPNTLIELSVLIYRFVFIFIEESKEIYTAQELKFGYSNFKNSLFSIGHLIKALIIRVFERYKDMVVTLDCKLYDGGFKIGD